MCKWGFVKILPTLKAFGINVKKLLLKSTDAIIANGVKVYNKSVYIGKDLLCIYPLDIT